MLSWALIFFVIAIVLGISGFIGPASVATGIAQGLFFVFLVLFVVSLVIGVSRNADPWD